MTTHTKSRKDIVLVAAITCAVLVAMLTLVLKASDSDSARTIDHISDTDTTVPSSYYTDVQDGSLGPILDPTDAISRSLVLMPDTANPHSGVAHLMRTATLDDLWFEVDHDSSDDQNSPVWIVGVLGEQLTADDVQWGASGSRPPSVPTDIRPVDGVFFVWEASTGYQLAGGAIADWNDWSYSRISSLPDEVLSISTATPAPSPTP